MFSRLRAAPLLSTYLVTSPSSVGWALGEREGNLRFSPPIGFDVIVTVIVFVELVRGEGIGVVRSELGIVVLGFVEDALDMAGAAVA